MCQISGIKCPKSTIIIISQALIPGNGNIFCQNSAWNASRLLNAQGNINWKRVHIESHLFAILIYAAVLYMYDTLYAISNAAITDLKRYRVI